MRKINKNWTQNHKKLDFLIVLWMNMCGSVPQRLSDLNLSQYESHIVWPLLTSKSCFIWPELGDGAEQLQRVWVSSVCDIRRHSQCTKTASIGAHSVGKAKQPSSPPSAQSSLSQPFHCYWNTKPTKTFMPFSSARLRPDCQLADKNLGEFLLQQQ